MWFEQLVLSTPLPGVKRNWRLNSRALGGHTAVRVEADPRRRQTGGDLRMDSSLPGGPVQSHGTKDSNIK